jgi:hypothetical protein
MFVSTDRILGARAGRRGFALPLAILALALVTAAVAASNAATRAEIVANQATRSQDRAYQLAEAGLQQFMARRGESGWCDHCVTNPSTSQYKTDSTETEKVDLSPYGYAQVVSVRVRPRILGDSVAIFFIYSRGVDTTVKMSGTGLTQYAERTVGQYATFRTKTIRPVAAFVSLTGLTETGSSLKVNGTDQCGMAPALTGLAVPTGEYVGDAGDVSSVSYSSADALKAALGIDWNAIINNNAIPADYTNTWPGNTWAVTRRSDANFTPTSDGRGILIAENDVTLSSNRDFDGIMLVGGRILTTTTSSAPSYGLVITGLNYTLPGAGNPPAGTSNNSSITNNKLFQYSSCNVATAVALLDTYYAWSNTWLDNVAIW